jgi:2-polyprenyl-3-methyl-5-hydroxy-6-metoxy-1,4-benzoquinol methylase
MIKSEKFWDKQSNNYDKQEKRYEQTYIQAVEITKKHLNISDIVLDYACGTGIITNEIAGSAKEIHAIDISSKMIDVAETKANERNIKNIHYAKATIFDKRFGKESFDVILAFSILHLLKDRQNVVQRINELLKPGGLLISVTACLGERKTPLSIILFLLSKIRIVPYVKLYKISELEDLVTNANFQIVETELLHFAAPSYFIVAKKI